MDADAAEVARLVTAEVDSFGLPELRPLQQGTPLPPEWFAAGMLEMRQALVPPFKITANDYDTTSGAVVARSVWAVADDGEGTLLGYDPNEAGDFVLLWRRPDQIAMSNIRGDAVGCFLAR